MTRRISMHSSTKLTSNFLLNPSQSRYPFIVKVAPRGGGSHQLNFHSEVNYRVDRGHAFIIAETRSAHDAKSASIFLIHEYKRGYDQIE